MIWSVIFVKICKFQPKLALCIRPTKRLNQKAELHLRYSIQFWVLDVQMGPAHWGQAGGKAASEGAGNHLSETQENTGLSSNRRVGKVCPVLCTLRQKSQITKFKFHVEKNILTRLPTMERVLVWGHNLSGMVRKGFLAVRKGDQWFTAWLCFGITGRIV